MRQEGSAVKAVVSDVVDVAEVSSLLAAECEQR